MLQNRATLKQIRFRLLSELRQIYSENESDSIVRLIMEHLGYPLSLALRDPAYVPVPPLNEQIEGIIAAIRTGMPIQYILGHTSFCDLDIVVDERVLIPRPETEEMVERIKTTLKPPVNRIIDLGTGSGCIALALKQHFADAEVWGVDLSREALSVAGENSRKNGLRVIWKAMDLLHMDLSDMPQLFDLVVSNPPYVLKSEGDLLSVHIKDFEPPAALFVEDDDPLVFYSAIASFCSKNLSEDGEIWVEINERFAGQTAGIFKEEGFGKIRILKDIHEKERYVRISR